MSQARIIYLELNKSLSSAPLSMSFFSLKEHLTEKMYNY